MPLCTKRNCELIASRISIAEITEDSAVYICICNALTDRRLKEAIAHGSNGSPNEVYAACGCRAKCGNCVRIVKEYLREHCPAPEPAPVCGN